ncbi:hypothetical protein [Hymenobacter volaticus]|uniref:Uncharacterized protein n=1 Tax=Hymenobacter volaticus TaxID=2932254 RepID=A0ABY4GE83_9BACT|nr:hypothetical protein [Hymenobacter volaticus]UOQ69158.1 hypothetical protein MUN86_25940 [Hymenobacter volaticus]
MLNRREAALFAALQLTHFSWLADGRGRLAGRCVPGIVGGAFYDLAGIQAEDGLKLTSLLNKRKAPQSIWDDWF